MDQQPISKHWWAILIRGIVAVLFALMAFFWTGLTLELLVILLGIYLLLDGLFAVVASLMATSHKNWWMLLLEGIISVAAGIAVFTWPSITVTVIVYLIGFWAIISGLIELISSMTAHWAIAGKMALALSGIFSLVLGLVIVFMPTLGLVALIWLIGIYALIFGLALIGFSFQARKA